MNPTDAQVIVVCLCSSNPRGASITPPIPEEPPFLQSQRSLHSSSNPRGYLYSSNPRGCSFWQKMILKSFCVMEATHIALCRDHQDKIPSKAESINSCLILVLCAASLSHSRGPNRAPQSPLPLDSSSLFLWLLVKKYVCGGCWEAQRLREFC